MKISAILRLVTLVLSIYVTPISTYLIVPRLFSKPLNEIQRPNQTPLMSVIPPGSGPSESGEGGPPASGDLIITDVIGKERSINIFAGFTRDIESISSRLDDTSMNSTILAPLNSQVQQLPRKPWEDPKEYGALGENAYKGAAGEDRAQSNLRRFVEAHIVPSSPWAEGEKTKTLQGNTVWWENKEGKKIVCYSSLCCSARS